MEDQYRTILEKIGEDPARAGLVDTPLRAAKAMAFLTRGYAQTLDQVVNSALFDSDTSEMILIQDIELYSIDRKSTRLNSSHVVISYAVFCLKKKICHYPIIRSHNRL